MKEKYNVQLVEKCAFSTSGKFIWVVDLHNHTAADCPTLHVCKALHSEARAKMYFRSPELLQKEKQAFVELHLSHKSIACNSVFLLCSKMHLCQGSRTVSLWLTCPFHHPSWRWTPSAVPCHRPLPRIRQTGLLPAGPGVGADPGKAGFDGSMPGGIDGSMPWPGWPLPMRVARNGVRPAKKTKKLANAVLEITGSSSTHALWLDEVDVAGRGLIGAVHKLHLLLALGLLGLLGGFLHLAQRFSMASYSSGFSHFLSFLPFFP